MGLLSVDDLPDMITGSLDYLHEVKSGRTPYVPELTIMAVVQYLYAVYCKQIPYDSKHVKSTLTIVCSVIPYQYREAVANLIRARNAIVRRIGTSKYEYEMRGIEEDLHCVLNWIT